MSELSELIGKQIHSIRKKKGLTQEQVAERTGKEGFNRSRISRIEQGQDNITLETLETIMTALGITPYELFDFNQYQDPLDFKDKSEMIEAYKYMLMERPVDEIKYVVRTTKDFFGTVDSKNSLSKDNK
ncbi:helix-turn-helix domain-containing protein [Paenibacillus pinistramenti]|uniref:helix-turn-helix domain-containing protein n=1 Tax=Paenibacillus pinistramenti TaxID=1768003 RepID=UPI001108DA37|nr:helix-turn-helix transcriptional regulator [Paenibacillus pinistramenti]